MRRRRGMRGREARTVAGRRDAAPCASAGRAPALCLSPLTCHRPLGQRPGIETPSPCHPGLSPLRPTPEWSHPRIPRYSCIFSGRREAYFLTQRWRGAPGLWQPTAGGFGCGQIRSRGHRGPGGRPPRCVGPAAAGAPRPGAAEKGAGRSCGANRGSHSRQGAPLSRQDVPFRQERAGGQKEARAGGQARASAGTKGGCTEAAGRRQSAAARAARSRERLQPRCSPQTLPLPRRGPRAPPGARRAGAAAAAAARALRRACRRGSACRRP
jgi:hypothetical protein